MSATNGDLLRGSAEGDTGWLLGSSGSSSGSTCVPGFG
jgi:hypothetical protein